MGYLAAGLAGAESEVVGGVAVAACLIPVVKKFPEGVIGRGEYKRVVFFNNMGAFYRELYKVTREEGFEEFFFRSDEGHFVPDNELEAVVTVFLKSVIGWVFICGGVLDE